MTEEYAGPRKPSDLVHGGDECAAVDEGYWGDDEEEIAFVKRWNCDPKTLGAYGEDLACELLKRNDYIILERNWSCAAGEADIIALDLKVGSVLGADFRMQHMRHDLGRPFHLRRRSERFFLVIQQGFRFGVGHDLAVFDGVDGQSIQFFVR